MSRRNDGDGDGDGTAPPPGLYPGILPAIPADVAEKLPDKNPRSNAATAASAAGVRALSAQAIQFYFRAPVKAFFRTRVDYLAYARSVHEAQTQQLFSQNAANGGNHATRLRQVWIWLRGTTPGVLTSAIRHHGWGVVPEQILPPLVANIGVGAVLYTSYLQILGRLHEDSGKASKRVYPPPELGQTFTAGFLAGSIQSVVAAPLDAIQARYDHRDLMPVDRDGNGPNGSGKPKSMWTFSAEKLREIGLRGIFAGWGLSFMKDSLGSAVFFSTFEYVKAQGYYRFVRWYYGALNEDAVDLLARKRPSRQGRAGGVDDDEQAVIKPHYAIEPFFLLLAGMSASITQQVLLHPLTHIQVEHWDHLEDLDAKAARIRKSDAANPERPKRRWRMFRAYYHAYQETWAQCLSQAAGGGQGIRRWLYRGFWWNTIRQVPSTSAGLIIFELVRRKYGMGQDEIRITRDGYDILLN